MSRTSVRSILESFDRNEHSFSELAAGEAIQQALRAGDLPETEHVQAQAEIIGLFLSDHSQDDDDSSVYYRPLAVFGDREGRTVKFPSLNDVTEQMLVYWQRRATESRHPVLRARYADLVWALTETATGKRPSADHARMAIDAAVEVSRMPLPDDVSLAGVWRKLRRALSLALSLNDRARVVVVSDAIVAFENSHGDDTRTGTWGQSYDLLLGNKRIPITEVTERQIIQALKDRLARTSSAGSERFSPWAAESAALRLAEFNRKQGRNEDVAQALRAYGSSFIHLAKQSPLAGASWLRGVHDNYVKFGLHDDAKALQPAIAEADDASLGSIKSVSTKMEISGEEQRRIVEAMMAPTLSETFEKIAKSFIVGKQRAEKEMKDAADAAPLQFLIQRHLLDSTGRVEAVVGPIDQDLDGQVVVHMTTMMSMNALFLRWGLDEAWKRFKPTIDDLCDIVFQSPVFHERQRVVVRRALDAYLAQDQIAFVHVLVPQIEQAVRQLVILTHGQHLVPGKRGEPPRLRLLHDLLRDPAFEGVFGNRVVEHFIVALTDERGLNLRNGIMHGYVESDQFHQQTSDILFHVLLVMAQVRATTPGQDEAGQKSL